MTNGDPDRVSKKNSVHVISRDHVFIARAVEAVAGHYNVKPFDSLDPALEIPPLLFLIDANADRSGGLDILRQLRNPAKELNTPILFIARVVNTEALDRAANAGATRCMTRPYLASELLRTVSDLACKTVEQSWRSLPARQAAALTGSLNAFDKMTAAANARHPLPMDVLEAGAADLLRSIRAGDSGQLLNAVLQHDNYTYAHSFSVATHLTELALTMGFAESDVLAVATGGLLHDVGKTSTPRAILNKPARLTDAEWVIMRNHVDASMAMIALSPDCSPIAKVIAHQHHERLDGTGYPQGLAGDEINELARIAAIVDIYGALTDRRPYKPSMRRAKALGIMGGMTSGLDQKLFALFVKLLPPEAPHPQD